MGLYIYIKSNTTSNNPLSLWIFTDFSRNAHKGAILRKNERGISVSQAALASRSTTGGIVKVIESKMKINDYE